MTSAGGGAVRYILPILFAAFSPAANAQSEAQSDDPADDLTEVLGDDLVRLAEALLLARAVRQTVWRGWEATPFPVLLVAADEEVLVDYPRVPPGFDGGGYSALPGMNISRRPRQFDPGLLATFPAFGLPPVVVIGGAGATGKKSTEWVLTLLHEHFHQYQMSDTGYFSEVDRLGLSNGDQSGMWMLNYPFPYKSAAVADSFAAISRRLARLLRVSSGPERQQFWKEYSGFLAGLSDKDRAYLSFQVWQEGVARYIELRVAEIAARSFHPSAEYLALADVDSFSIAADNLRSAILTELESPDLPGRRRNSFYAFGAGLGLLLDQDGSSWKQQYPREKFFIERYAGTK